MHVSRTDNHRHTEVCKNATPRGNIFPSTNQQSQQNIGTHLKHHETNFLVNIRRKK